MKSINYILGTALICSAALLSACDDVLETESERQVFDLELNSKTDSLFFSFGVMQAMQQLADEYVLQNVMRGDLAELTTSSDNDLRELANFSAGLDNKYDSAYVYYRVINNCNYYITHRDTTLMEGSTNVVMNEYAAIKAFRAWAYLQAVRQYGKVPFFTEPLTKISQINNNDYPELDIYGVVERLAPDLAQYTGYEVPNYGTIACGSTNFGSSKTAYSRLCFIPVDIILGDLYLEVGEYAKAAQYYTAYLLDADHITPTASLQTFSRSGFSSDYTLPTDFPTSTSTTWNAIFNLSATTDIISYIPMSVNRLRGTTTNLPKMFGYNFYITSTDDESMYTETTEIVPSASYKELSDSTTYYYSSSKDPLNTTISGLSIGDMRKPAMVTTSTNSSDSSVTYVKKFNGSNIILYRVSTVYLHLAEALNRLGYPDAAFAILKDGLTYSLASDTTYMTTESKELLTTTYPFINVTYVNDFTSSNTIGMHGHGAGYVKGTFTPYQFSTVVGNKMQRIASDYGVDVGTTKQDTINAVEDLLCDEYALEFAFEGTRFSDLMRLARHKNTDGLYGSTFGYTWLASKLEYKNPQKDLTVEDNWYLPFK